ncbi:FkbM family methyltransferase [Ekhidna sp.]|jgi:FkbM family methyltransferase|uniref:FkbM family methyltransferase n=1 Tax=Ekhidna sp. TaxID=2608089 RepID=UPI0032ED9E96
MGINKLIRRIRKGLAYKLAKSRWHQLAIHHAFSGYAQKSVFLPDINLTIKEYTFILLLEGYDNAKKIVEYGGHFEINRNQLLLYIDGITLEIQTAEELFIVSEIFINKCYEFHLKGECAVIDIGMNVGIASLYFASMPSTTKVYGFEPFNPTYEQANVNFNLNSHLKKKIVPQNIGFGLQNERLSVEYSTQNRGRVGVYGRKFVKGIAEDISHEVMDLRSASEILEQLKKESGIQNFIVKMDCEGAEFDIINNLHQYGQLRFIQMLMLEWHEKEPLSIIDRLKKNEFRIFKMNYSPTVGMIYAVRS